MPPASTASLRVVALVSLFYDVAVGAALFFGRSLLTQWFGVPAPQPPIHVDLNAIFVTTIGIGYILPFRDPERYRAYLWLMGPILKGAGAAAFVLDYLWRGSPASYLLFALSDGSLALLTLAMLVRTTRRAAGPGR